MENENKELQQSSDPKPSSQTDQIMESLALLQKKFTDFEALLSNNKTIENDKSVVELPKEEPQQPIEDESWKDYNF